MDEATKSRRITHMVRAAKECRATARKWKALDYMSAPMVARELGEARGLLRAARMLKGWETEAKSVNRIRRVRSIRTEMAVL